jgi:hypothetical protein
MIWAMLSDANPEKNWPKTLSMPLAICLEPLPDQEPLALLGAEIELLASLDLSADNTAEKQRGRPFDPGQSGNP